jgi:hypothetical protein
MVQGPVYLTTTLLPLMDVVESTLLFCSMLISVALDVGDWPLAVAPVKVMVPKLESGTSELPSSKSSTIHSAFSWQSDGWPVNEWVTVWPDVWLMIVAEPAVRLVAVTVVVIESPAWMVMPEKSEAKAGNHSNQAKSVQIVSILKLAVKLSTDHRKRPCRH